MVAFAIIPIAIAVPSVIMNHAPAIAFPIAVVEPVVLITRYYPACGWISGSCPVSVMPLVVVPNGIPVAVYPYKTRTWRWRMNAYNTRWRWRANSHAHRELCVEQ